MTPPVTTANRRQTKAGRQYEIENEFYVGVTTMLGLLSKPALVPWAAKVERDYVVGVAGQLYDGLRAHQSTITGTKFASTLSKQLGPKAHTQQLKSAGNIGSEAHGLIEHRLRIRLGQPLGPEPDVSDPARWAVSRFEDWAGDTIKPELVEQVVYSTTHQYAGTRDLVATVAGQRLLIDFKTGKRIYREEAFLQSAFYQVALAEMGHGAVDGAVVIRLPKVVGDPDVEVAAVPSLEELWPACDAILRLWKWRQEIVF